MVGKRPKTMAEILRQAVASDGRSIWRLARDADIHYPILYLFIKGDKSGHRRGLTLDSADKLAKALNLELRPKKKGR
ncbi:unnamed protein product [marine sediment metagenome]|uniref:HTH cro/C1-type domain-containing protein n=1 Tax=marine sediment metagenome TaxID=412755 RepID=X0VA84_9ZZZZ